MEIWKVWEGIRRYSKFVARFKAEKYQERSEEEKWRKIRIDTKFYFLVSKFIVRRNSIVKLRSTIMIKRQNMEGFGSIEKSI